MSSDDLGRQPLPDRTFATTRWSLVVSAGKGSSEQSNQALATLCEFYWYPLYAYARRRCSNVHEAQDSTQAFFVELLDKNVVGSAMPERGRFRAFLLTSFKNFLAKQWRKAQAQKRGGGKSPISLDFETADSRYLNDPPDDGLTADQLFCRQWALSLLSHVMQKLQDESERAGKSNQFKELKCFLIGDHKGTTYAQVAMNLGTTEGAAKKAASRLRQRYRQILCEEIAETVASADEIDEEIRDLFAVLSL